MDCQNGIVGRIEDSDALIERVARAIATARRRGVRIGYVRVAFDEADAKAIPAANKGFSRMARMIGAFHSDAPATQIDARIAPQRGDIIVSKSRVGAFSTTSLREQLEGAGITTRLQTFRRHRCLRGSRSRGARISR